jgi:hypothetical protein
MFTTVAAGQFRMCFWIDITVAGSAGTYEGMAQFTSDGHSFTPFVGPTVAASTQWASTTTGTNTNNCSSFYADAATAIKYELFASSVTGSPTVRYAVSLEQMQ